LSARLQSIIGKPVRSRSDFTAVAVISAINPLSPDFCDEFD